MGRRGTEHTREKQNTGSGIQRGRGWERQRSSFSSSLTFNEDRSRTVLRGASSHKDNGNETAVHTDVLGSGYSCLSQSVASRNGMWRVRKARGVDDFGGALVCGEDCLLKGKKTLCILLLVYLHKEHIRNLYLTKH